jgi:hypothetical protein
MNMVDVFSGSLEADERLSKNEIRNRSLLGGLCFGIFIGVPLIYGTFFFVTPRLLVFVRLVQKPFLLIIYLSLIFFY